MNQCENLFVGVTRHLGKAVNQLCESGGQAAMRCESSQGQEDYDFHGKYA